MEITSYKDLLVWQKAMNLVELIYSATADFPRSEEFGLAAQMRRAAISIPSNVAEGNVRKSTKEYHRFLSIALGSVAELETQVEIARRLRFMPEAEALLISQKSQEVGKMLNGLRRSLYGRRIN